MSSDPQPVHVVNTCFNRDNTVTAYHYRILKSSTNIMPSSNNAVNMHSRGRWWTFLSPRIYVKCNEIDDIDYSSEIFKAEFKEALGIRFFKLSVFEHRVVRLYGPSMDKNKRNNGFISG